VVNYTSALLIVGSRKTVGVARRSLAGVPRGPVLGIAGAPDALPAKADLLRGQWSACSRPTGGGPRSLVAVGTTVAGAPLGEGGLLVSTPDGAVHLVWNGRRALLRNPAELLPILVWGTPVPVATSFVNALPAAADLARVPVPGRGQPFPPVAGARVGQVFVVDGRQHAVALAGGLAPVTAFQAALLLGDPATVEQVRQKSAWPLSAGEYASVPRVELPGAWHGLPDALPQLTTPAPGSGVCVVGGGSVVVGVALREGTMVPSTAGELALPPGRGAVVEALPAPDSPSGALFLVTDLGVRHALPSAEVLPALGYAGIAPVRVPAEVVALLPTGAALHPQAARQPAG
jgi:type VII secretion protein EccB